MQMREASRRPRRAGKRRVNRTARLIRLVLAVALLAVTIYLVRAFAVIGVGTPKYYNVTVNGVSLEGYTKTEARKLFGTLEDGWLNEEYTLTYQDQSWSFNAAMFDANLDIDTQLELAWNLGHYGSLSNRVKAILALRDAPRAFTSELSYDEGKLDAFIAGIQAVTDVAAVDAEIVLDVDAPRVITDSSDGAQLDEARTRQAIMDLLLTGTGETALAVNVVQPAISSDEASGGMALISKYSTDVSDSSTDRRFNVSLALSYFNGLEVKPGMEISFNTIVGERTTARKFREAPEYDGTTVVNGIGGGSCQASTTLYCAVMMAGMDIVERHPHNMTVAYADPSKDATVSWGKKDFVFKNNTEHTIYIYTKVTDDTAYVVVYGNKPEYRIDFQSTITKQTIASTKEEVREDVTGRYAYYTDEKYLYKEGKSGCESQGWLIYYDWETDQEVSRKQVSDDTYAPGTSTYFVGVHSRTPDVTVNPTANY